jgi:hypothetical protein
MHLPRHGDSMIVCVVAVLFTWVYPIPLTLVFAYSSRVGNAPTSWFT